MCLSILHLLSLTILLANASTFVSGNKAYKYPTAHSAAAKAYAASTGCEIGSHPPICDADACFEKRGRCKRIYRSAPGRCLQHVVVFNLEGDIVTREISTKWVAGKPLVPVECLGCTCRRVRATSQQVPKRKVKGKPEGGGGRKEAVEVIVMKSREIYTAAIEEVLPRWLVSV